MAIKYPIYVAVYFCFFLTSPLIAQCPSADVTDDCRVDLADLAVLTSQWLSEGESSDMVLIAAGTFEMGDSLGDGMDRERPVHTVTVSAFRISRYETTNSEFCEFLNSAMQQSQVIVNDGIVYIPGPDGGYPCCKTQPAEPESQIAYSHGVFTVMRKNGRDMSRDPMVEVTWYGAAAFCNWRSEQEGLQACYDLTTWRCDFSKDGYHLPTEAQWECAARAGLLGNRFPWGDTITHAQANYRSDSHLDDYDMSQLAGCHPVWDDGTPPYTSPVGSFIPNAYGLYDMVGNVWEWCNDWFQQNYYAVGPAVDPTSSTKGVHRVYRGGSWANTADACRVAMRAGDLPTLSGPNCGFRLCR